MMAEPEAPKRGDALLGLVESLGRLAADSTTSIISRFEAIGLLAAPCHGPRHCGADGIDVAASRHARIALANVGWFLDQTRHQLIPRTHSLACGQFVASRHHRGWPVLVTVRPVPVCLTAPAKAPSAPILLRLSRTAGAFGFLTLTNAPSGPSGMVSKRFGPHDALAAQLAAAFVDDCAVAVVMLVQHDIRQHAPQELRQPRHDRPACRSNERGDRQGRSARQRARRAQGQMQRCVQGQLAEG